MAKLPVPKFNLRLPGGDSETLISLVFRYKGKRLVYSTNHSIHPNDWDFKTQRPIIRSKRTDLFSVQNLLNELAQYCLEIYLAHSYGSISIVEFRKQLDIKLGRREGELENASSSPSFFEFVEAELVAMKSSNMSYHSWKNYNLHAKILRNFGKDYGGKQLFTYEDVDWNFRLKLVDWLAERNAQVAYGNKTLKTLRQLLERARKQKLHNNTDYQGVGWTVSPKRAKGELVTLGLAELNKLSQMSLNVRLSKIRDVFLIGAGTGQRFGDFSHYTSDNFYTTLSGIPILTLISSKTSIPTKVPLNLFEWLLPVLERHNYVTPKISMQKFNDGLKELCELAGFNDRTLIVEQYMGRKARLEKYYVEKFKVVSSHCCRRSFATNLYRMGYQLSQIMPMTGHSTESQLRQYIGIDNEQNAESIGLDILRTNENQSQYANGYLRMVK